MNLSIVNLIMTNISCYFEDEDIVNCENGTAVMLLTKGSTSMIMNMILHVVSFDFVMFFIMHNVFFYITLKLGQGYEMALFCKKPFIFLY